MEKFCFFIRSITLAMGLTACSGLNQEVISQDIELLEEINEDIQEILRSGTIEPEPIQEIIKSLNFGASQKPLQLLA